MTTAAVRPTAEVDDTAPADPGSTTVAPKAVRRIAAQVAREVDGVDRDVRVQAHVSGARTALDVRLPIEYPKPIDRVTEACRTHLAQRMAALTGMTVARIDIEVSKLTVTNRSANDNPADNDTMTDDMVTDNVASDHAAVNSAAAGKVSAPEPRGR